MKDSVTILRHIAKFELPSRADDLLRVAREIDDIRSILADVRESIDAVLPSSYTGPGEEYLNRWQRYLSMPPEVGGLLRTVDNALADVTPEQRELFGDHKMTRRAWSILREAGLMDADSIYWANPRNIARMPNAGRKTVAEIARLRHKIASARLGEAA